MIEMKSTTYHIILLKTTPFVIGMENVRGGKGVLYMRCRVFERSR